MSYPRSCRQDTSRTCINNKAPVSRQHVTKPARNAPERTSSRLSTLSNALSIQPVRTRNEFNGTVVQQAAVRKSPPVVRGTVRKCSITTSRPPNSPVLDPSNNEIINTAQQVLLSARKYNEESTDKLVTVLNTYKTGPRNKPMKDPVYSSDVQCLYKNSVVSDPNKYYLESEIRDAVENIDFYKSGTTVPLRKVPQKDTQTYPNPYGSNFMSTFLNKHPEHKAIYAGTKAGRIVKQQNAIEKDNKIPVQKKSLTLPPKKAQPSAYYDKLTPRIASDLSFRDSLASLDNKPKFMLEEWRRPTSKSANPLNERNYELQLSKPSHKAVISKPRAKLSPKQIEKTISQATQRINEMKTKYGEPSPKTVMSRQNLNEDKNFPSILSLKCPAKSTSAKIPLRNTVSTGVTMTSARRNVAPSVDEDDFSDDESLFKRDLKNEDDDVIAILRKLQKTRRKQAETEANNKRFFSSGSESESESFISEDMKPEVDRSAAGTQATQTQETKVRKTYLDATKSHYLLKDMSLKNKEPIGNIESLLDASPRKNQNLLNKLKCKYPKFFFTKEADNIRSSYKIEQRLKAIDNLDKNDSHLGNSLMRNTMYQDVPTRCSAALDMGERTRSAPQRDLHKYQYPSKLYSYK